VVPSSGSVWAFFEVQLNLELGKKTDKLQEEEKN
jgi:hypothetical protein